jgi:hypothetical protein
MSENQNVTFEPSAPVDVVQDVPEVREVAPPPKRRMEPLGINGAAIPVTNNPAPVAYEDDSDLVFFKSEVGVGKKASDSFYIGPFRFDICELPKATKQWDNYWTAFAAKELGVSLDDLKGEQFRVHPDKADKYDELIEGRYDRILSEGLVDWTLPHGPCNTEMKLGLLVKMKREIYRRIVAASRYGAGDEDFSKG